MFWKAAKSSALLSALFLVVYGGCNQITSLRHDVGTWVYDWERLIPFVPLFIIPYLSIDLFFVASPFLCTNDAERKLLARRITLAILTAGAVFLLMPLRMTFSRPAVEGWIGTVFAQFLQMDKPYNLAPSLHIALRTILADTYARHTRGVLHWVVQIWFVLIGLSTLLVYQHHFVDVVGGFMLAVLCFYIVGSGPMRTRGGSNGRVGAYYLAGAAVLAVMAVLLGSWALWLLWPALAMFLVAAGYLGFGPAIYRKRDGRLPLSSRLVLLPVLAGQHLSLRYYARQCRSCDRVADHVWIGRKLREVEAADAVANGVTAVIDLTGDFSEAPSFLKLAYLNLQVLDLTAPTREQVEQAVRFIDQHARSGVVYIHCKIGYSRSAAIAGAWLIHAGLVDSAEAAISQLRCVRPSIVVRPEARESIENYRVSTVQVAVG